MFINPVQRIARFFILRSMRHIGNHVDLYTIMTGLFTLFKKHITLTSIFNVIPVFYHFRQIFYTPLKDLFKKFENNSLINPILLLDLKAFLQPYEGVLAKVVKAANFRHSFYLSMCYVIMLNFNLFKPVMLYFSKLFVRLVFSALGLLYSNIEESMPFLYYLASSFADILGTYLNFHIPRNITSLATETVKSVSSNVPENIPVNSSNNSNWGFYTSLLLWSLGGVAVVVSVYLIGDKVCPDLTHSTCETISSYFSAGLSTVKDAYTAGSTWISALFRYGGGGDSADGTAQIVNTLTEQLIRKHAASGSITRSSSGSSSSSGSTSSSSSTIHIPTPRAAASDLPTPPSTPDFLESVISNWE